MIENHRFLSKLDKLLKKGTNQIILYGKGISDYFLYDTFIGIRELDKNLFYYFVENGNFDYFINIKDNKEIIILDKNKNIHDIRDIFSRNVQKKGFGANQSPKTELRQEEESQIEIDENNAFINIVSLIKRNINKKRLFIFIENIEWLTGLYSQQVDNDFIKFLFELKKSKNSVSILSMKEPLKLNEYGFEIDLNDEYLVYVGYPSIQEMKRSFRRVIYKNNADINELEFDDIIAGLKGNKRSLRESIKILKEKLKIKNELNFDDFEDVIDLNVVSNITLNDIVINSKIKKTLETYIRKFLNGDKDRVKGVLLYGPPGTGKTAIAKALANEFKINFLAPTLSDLKGEFVGQSSAKVKKVFEEARANAPTILFLDEIDTIFKKRGAGNTDSYTEDMVNQFLVEVDGAKSDSKDVFIIGSTNRPDILDDAVKSRLSTLIRIDLPDRKSRERILAKRFKKINFYKLPYKDEILDRTDGMSGRDLDELVKKIKSRKQEHEIEYEDFDRELIQFEKLFIEEFEKDLDYAIKIAEPKIDFSYIVGYEYIISALKDEVEYIKLPKEQKEEMKKFNIVQQRGVLLYGPPGNGKTTFAEALAGENNFYYIRVISKAFNSGYVDEVLEKLDLIFNNTLKLSRITHKDGIVLFFDEIDALIHKDMNIVIRSSLLKYLEDKQGIKSENSKVILIGATNYIEVLDEASIREGRFDNKFFVGYPRDRDLVNILKRFFENDNILSLEVSDSFYKTLIDRKKVSKKKLAIVDLKNIKETIKRLAYKRGYIENGKIIIKEELLN